ncbi:LysR family transcriptional regulator [Mycobacterium sp. ITM-2016-00317]|uniref:LysR family transcriptional regulator n=1 Tax=Mycobacterium sp. ITM-2016-00317 TaxID=2099694 RepID=UPI00287F984E|nr:LysR family transcriptional regulator [Mycobacterium sp. ITM-2016-00317]WNG87271.1 LysR family transcriptional regulator [Mycobacterium sp. ITM-2016-00317]
MHVLHTLRADLNLVPALAILLEERHISRAAARLGLSQPATSRALQRLRSLLGDPLLIRERDGYRLTARAQILRDQLEGVLPALEALVSPDDFDPAVSTTEIHLAGTDFAVQTYGPAICATLMHESPGSGVRFHSWRYDSMAEAIHRGRVELGLFGVHSSGDLSAADLLTEQFVCVVDADHPATGPALMLAEYCRLRHLVIDVTDGLQPDVDLPLQERGLRRRAMVTVPYHSVVPLILAGTDLVATIPASLARQWPAGHRVRILQAPAEVRRLTYRMVWHPAYDNDRRHRWLRSTVRTAALTAGATPA